MSQDIPLAEPAETMPSDVVPFKIETDEFEFARRDYFWMMFSDCLASSYLRCAYAVVVLLSVKFIFSGVLLDLFAVILLVGLGIGIPLSHFFQYWRFVSHPHQQAVYQKRKLTFDNERCTIAAADGTMSSVPLDTLIYAAVRKHYYLLYFQPYCCFPVLQTAFRSEEDRVRFEQEILAKIPKYPSPYKAIRTLIIVTVILFCTAVILRLFLTCP